MMRFASMFEETKKIYVIHISVPSYTYILLHRFITGGRVGE